jgi:hypothetical protein
MTVKSLGLVAVPVSGTSVVLDGGAGTKCWKVRVQAVIGSSARLYLGDSTMGAGTANTGVIKQFWPTTGAGASPAVPADQWEMDAGGGGSNVINLSDYKLDSSVNGDGAFVTYWTR